LHFYHRLVVPGCAGCAMAYPDFVRSVNPISTRGDRLCLPNYYWHARIFGPISPSKICENLKFSTEIQIFANFLCSKIISTLNRFSKIKPLISIVYLFINFQDTVCVCWIRQRTFQFCAFLQL
jgi:hypothetical protein